MDDQWNINSTLMSLIGRQRKGRDQLCNAYARIWGEEKNRMSAIPLPFLVGIPMRTENVEGGEKQKQNMKKIDDETTNESICHSFKPHPGFEKTRSVQSNKPRKNHGSDPHEALLNPMISQSRSIYCAKRKTMHVARTRKRHGIPPVTQCGDGRLSLCEGVRPSIVLTD
ncbi:hypothetical protein BDW42DRAFT_102564 [Aspergillus taichungensis]|uniref:Uncharacterized protein n=1 Tax=Aspergillus taichungensis TaxID=482145 RepID=A0A2J5HUE6_9EURO|nr:hypothetical protein BDW42DRAFT_102564 [Aspergillus taichungensis]